MRKLFWLPLLFLAAAALSAPQVQVIPPNPTEGQIVQLDFVNCGATVTRTGNAFRVVMFASCIGVFPPTPATLGRLAPGTYTYQIFYADQQLYASGSFVVAPSIPALSPWSLAFAGVLLAIVGVAMIAIVGVAMIARRT